jgi:hypothetical protein
VHIWFAISTKVIVPSFDIVESGAISLVDIGLGQTQIYGTNLSFNNWQHRYKQQKPSQVRFLSESQHTITKMSDNLNMTGTLVGKAESVD